MNDPFGGALTGCLVLVAVPFGIAWIVMKVIEGLEWLFTGRRG